MNIVTAELAGGVFTSIATPRKKVMSKSIMLLLVFSFFWSFSHAYSQAILPSLVHPNEQIVFGDVQVVLVSDVQVVLEGDYADHNMEMATKWAAAKFVDIPTNQRLAVDECPGYPDQYLIQILGIGAHTDTVDNEYKGRMYNRPTPLLCAPKVLFSEIEILVLEVAANSEAVPIYKLESDQFVKSGEVETGELLFAESARDNGGLVWFTQENWPLPAPINLQQTSLLNQSNFNQPWARAEPKWGYIDPKYLTSNNETDLASWRWNLFRYDISCQSQIKKSLALVGMVSGDNLSSVLSALECAGYQITERNYEASFRQLVNQRGRQDDFVRHDYEYIGNYREIPYSPRLIYAQLNENETVQVELVPTPNGPVVDNIEYKHSLVSSDWMNAAAEEKFGPGWQSCGLDVSHIWSNLEFSLSEPDRRGRCQITTIDDEQYFLRTNKRVSPRRVVSLLLSTEKSRRLELEANVRNALRTAYTARQTAIDENADATF